MNTWKVILATLVIFGAGLATGMFITRHSETNKPPRQNIASQSRPTPLSSAGGLRLEFLRRAQRELDLSPDQRERIDIILKDSQERSRKLMEPVAPELRAELQRTKDEFLLVLTPEQRIRFEYLIKKQRPHDPRHPPLSHPTLAPSNSLERSP